VASSSIPSAPLRCRSNVPEVTTNGRIEPASSSPITSAGGGPARDPHRIAGVPASPGVQSAGGQNGNEALEIAKNYLGRIDVLVADVIMPYVRGTELTKMPTALRPEMCVVLISGYSEDALLENQPLADGSIILLQKPFESEELVQKIRESPNRKHSPPETRSM
jgi:CheY-like chemotaxis protein